MAVKRKYRLNLRNYGNLPAIMLSQYDEGYALEFEIRDGTDAASDLSAYTVTLKGTRADTLAYSFAGTVSTNVLTFVIDTTMTACAGRGTAEIAIKDTANDVLFATFNMPVFVERAAVPEGSIDADVERAQEIAEQVQEIVDNAAANVSGEAEKWATGQINGTDVPSTDPTYENNAKYYAEQAADAAASIGIDATLTQAGKAADAKKTGDEITALKEDFNNILDDRNGDVSVISTGDYGLANASIINGVFTPGAATHASTKEYIDCRGLKYLEFKNVSKYLYFSWYSAASEDAFVSNSGRWYAEDNIRVIPVADYLRVTVRDANSSIIQPSFGEMDIETVGVIEYLSIISDKQLLAPNGYEVININDNFVKGGISSTGDIVYANSSICTLDYINVENAKSLYIDIPSGYNVAVVFFKAENTTEVARLLGLSGSAYVTVKDGYNLAKIALYKSTNIYPGEAKDLSCYALHYCHGYDTKEVTQTNSIVSNNFVPGSKVSIAADSEVTIMVTNENMLLREHYESTRKVMNGITFTVNENGSITANGTATNDADFLFRSISAPTINIVDTPLFFSCLYAPSDDYFAYLNGSSQADLGEGVRLSLENRRNKITTGFIRIRSGKTVDNVVFYPMLSIGTARPEYVSSQGKIISNVTEIEVSAMRGKTIVTATGEITVTGMVGINRLVNMKHSEIIADQKQHGWRSNNHIVSICHRGYLTEAPENTIYAFRDAVADNIDYLESDIWFTSDHVPVMFHDPTIDRVVNGHTGTIRDYTWAEVQTFDVYTYFQNQYPDKWKPEFANARIMSFEEYLRFCKGVGVPTMLEIKDPNCSETERQSVINLINKYDFADCILWFGSLTSYPNLYSIINAFPNAILNLGVDGTSVTQYHINLLNTLRTGENNVGIATDNYTSADVDICKQNKVPLTVYMIDTLQAALDLDPYIHAALSNSQNVRKVLKEYYMGT